MNTISIAKKFKVSQANISMLLNGSGKNQRKTTNIKLSEYLSKMTGRPVTDFLSPKIAGAVCPRCKCKLFKRGK